MRTLSSGVSTNAAIAVGTEPVIVVAIQPTQFNVLVFADKDGNYGGYHCLGRILDIGNLTQQVKLGQLGTVSNISFRISDSDGQFKTLVDFTQLEGKPVSVYQAYEGIADMTLLFRGVLSSPITWSEGHREVSLTAQSSVRHKEVGFHMTAGMFTDGNPDVFGRAWPLVFGKASHVPTLQIRKHAKGKLQEAIALTGDLYHLGGSGVPRLVAANGMTMLQGSTNVANQFIVTGGLLFPQNADLDLIVDDTCVFRGQFHNNETFIVTQSNLPKYTHVVLASRGDSNEPNPTVEAQAMLDGRMAWIEPNTDESYTSVVNHLCILHPQGAFAAATTAQLTRLCVKQEGGRLTFDKPWTYNGKTLKLDGTMVFDEVRAIQVSGFVTDVDRVVADMLQRIADFQVSGNGSSSPDKYSELQATLDRLKVANDAYWKVAAGATVRRWDAPDPDVYVCNLVSSNDVLSVYGEREINGEKWFAPIPTTYYQKNTSQTITGVGTVTTLTLYKALSDYKGQGWTENIWASVDSTLSNNPIDVIKYLLLNYSDYAVGSTFTTERTKTAKFECHFALETNEDVIKVCEDIAWKARCGLRFSNGVADIVYLSARPASVFTFNRANTLFQSAEISFTPTEEIRTHAKSLWASSGRPLDAKINEQPTFVEDFCNENIYGSVKLVKGRSYLTRHTVRTERDLHTVDINFNIFNTERPVRYSTAFWLNRLANSWRTIKLTTFMPGLILEVYDGVTISIPELQASILGVVTKTEYNPRNSQIICEVWLPCVSGTVLEQISQTVMSPAGTDPLDYITASKFGAWRTDSDYNTPDNPTDNLTETSYDVQFKSRHVIKPETILRHLQREMHIFARYSGPETP